MTERCFKDREVCAALDQPASLGLHRLEIEFDFDRVCSAVVLLGDSPNLVARGKQRFGLVRDLAKLRVVFLQVQLLGALPGGDEAGFGEIGFSSGQDSIRKVWSISVQLTDPSSACSNNTG